jgi:mRNA interferase MazF
MTGFEFGDVVLVPFPFTDQSAVKQRPAVVISSAAYHRARPDIVIMAITSQVRPRLSLGEAAIGNWKQAGLLKPSVFKPLLATVDQGLIRRKLGRLSPDDLQALRASLPTILGGQLSAPS